MEIQLLMDAALRIILYQMDGLDSIRRRMIPFEQLKEMSLMLYVEVPLIQMVICFIQQVCVMMVQFIFMADY